MAGLTSDFTREDIETLLEATGDWEMLGNHDFHILQMIKGAPLPPDDHEAFEVMQQIKDHYRKREKEIMAHRVVRQEKAVFLKAKLMLVRKDLGVSQLFDMAANVDLNSPTPEVVERAERHAPKEPTEEEKSKLELAEFFIRDLGVWAHYEKFIAEKQGGKSE